MQHCDAGRCLSLRNMSCTPSRPCAHVHVHAFCPIVVATFVLLLSCTCALRAFLVFMLMPRAPLSPPFFSTGPSSDTGMTRGSRHLESGTSDMSAGHFQGTRNTPAKKCSTAKSGTRNMPPSPLACTAFSHEGKTHPINLWKRPALVSPCQPFQSVSDSEPIIHPAQLFVHLFQGPHGRPPPAPSES